MSSNLSNGQHDEFRYVPKNAQERHELISKRAYLLAKERGFKPGFEKHDWLEAESFVDKMIFDSATTPNDLYKTVMAKFFASVNTENLTSLGVAHAFFDFIHHNKSQLANFEDILGPKIKNDFRNVAILTDDVDIASLTKRNIILADSTLLSHTGTSYNEFKTDRITRPTPYAITDISYEVNCPDFAELGLWLTSCKELLNVGDVFYFPRVRVIDRDWNDSNWLYNEATETDDHLFEAIVSSRKLISANTKNLLKLNLIKAIAEVEIPVIENVDLLHFSKISVAERQELEKFRYYIKCKFEDITDGISSEFFDYKLDIIGREMERDFHLLSNDFSKIKSKRALNATGATVITVLATLVAVNSQFFSEIMTVLTGGGGGLAALWKIFEDYRDQRDQLNNKGYYYLWLLSKP